MGVPEAIRAVPRPKNTYVYSYGKNNDLYAVRERKGCKRVNGRNLPINGKVVGHIIDMKYVPIEESIPSISQSGVVIKDWANVILCHRLFHPILEDLKKVYNSKDATKLYCMALLRTIYPGIVNKELKEKYETSFLSVLYPDVALSKNTVSTFLEDLGKTSDRIVHFMQNRAEAVGLDHRLLVDGSLKTNDSKVNSFSEFSHKARMKGRKDLNLLFAFDLEEMEPVSSMVFPGNMLDLTAYKEFVKHSGLKKGIIVADKGFPAKKIEAWCRENPGLYYLNPIKRNSTTIQTHHLYDYTGLLKGYKGVLYRKEKIRGKNKWLYSFKDINKEEKEKSSYLERKKKEGTFSLEKLKKKEPSFGTIVLESNLDASPELIYKTYEERWNIEEVIRFYKMTLAFDSTRVHDDYSVIGSEFVDFLSLIGGSRLKKAFDSAHLLDDHSFKDIMKVLQKAKKASFHQGDWQLRQMTQGQIKILQELDLIPKEEKRPRGRPRTKPVEVKPKRKPGRPPGRKNNKTLEKLRLAKQAAEKSVQQTEPAPESSPKRKRGRPPKRIKEDKLKESAAETGEQSKRKRGRPRKSDNRK